MDGSKIISIEHAVPALTGCRFAEPVRRGEQWAVVGTNGSGKSLLADILLGRYLLKEGRVRHSLKGKLCDGVKSISFRDIHSLADMRNAYYRQRWHATETDDLPAVGELFPSAAASDPAGMKICEALCIEASLSKKIIHLSSGELRKILIVRAAVCAGDTCA
ncbi:MAG: ATP-binding cassette domain-containing protein [Tannerella sp.]|jgi:molybdate transport system ATP-binding protein|nr:ATP-binding cassette domain-containing protein [Tannerella sp.]